MARVATSPIVRAATIAAAAFALAASAGGAADGPPAASPAPAVASPAADASPAVAGPQFFLSWGRPWGEPGARQVRQPSCDDTTHADTLFLCLRPGVELPGFAAFTAEISFHAEPPETLGTYWHFERGAENQSGVSVRFQPEEGDSHWVQPWRSNGNGGVGYVRAAAVGRLRMIYAVEPSKAADLQGHRLYTLARIAFQARAPGLGGCDQGVAFELSRATIAADSLQEHAIRTGGVRHAGSGRRAIAALARLWQVDEQSARWRLGRVEPAEPWPPAK